MTGGDVDERRLGWAGRLLQIGLIAAFLGGAVGLAVFLVLTKKPPERREPPSMDLLVRAIRAEAVPTTMTVVATGAVRAQANLTLAAQVPGEVVFMSPSLLEGRFFSKGDLLVRIDDRSYNLAVKELEAQVTQGKIELARLDKDKANAEAELKLAEKDAELAKREYDRAGQLVATGTDSKAALDRAEAVWVSARLRVRRIRNQLDLWPHQHEMAKTRLEQLRSQLADAELKLSYTKIAAPFDGRAVERLVETGRFVGAGTPLARVYGVSVMEIPVRVPLEELKWVDTSCLVGAKGNPPSTEDGTPGRSRLPAAEARLRVGQSLYCWDGVVARADAVIDPRTRTAGLIVETSDARRKGEANPGPPLIPGLFVEVEIEGRRVDAAIALPRGALDQGGVVYCVEDGKLSIRRVNVIRAVEDTIYVEGEIEAGDMVIVTPIAAPVDGREVKIADEGSGE